MRCIIVGFLQRDVDRVISGLSSQPWGIDENRTAGA
jgi:hypothetical protein